MSCKPECKTIRRDINLLETNNYCQCSCGAGNTSDPLPAKENEFSYIVASAEDRSNPLFQDYEYHGLSSYERCVCCGGYLSDRGLYLAKS